MAKLAAEFAAGRTTIAKLQLNQTSNGASDLQMLTPRSGSDGKIKQNHANVSIKGWLHSQSIKIVRITKNP